MNFQVKVCGVTREADICAVCDAGVNFVGVNRHSLSPRFVSEFQLQSLLKKIPAGRRVFVDVSPAAEKLSAAKNDGFDFFQIHFDAENTARDVVAAWENCVGRARLWLAPRVPDGAIFPEWILPFADTILFDGFHKGVFGGTGRTADWARFSALKKCHRSHQWILAGGLNPENLTGAIHASGADFFDLNSGIEISPGIKSVEKLSAALSVLGKNEHFFAENDTASGEK